MGRAAALRGLTLLSRRAAKYQHQLDRVLVATAVVAPLACLVAAALALARLDSWPAARFLALYVAPIFLATPLWARERLCGIVAAPGESGWRMMMDVAVVLLSFARFVMGDALPYSGHMLFLTYTALLPASRAYRILAAVLLIETTVFKLVLWHDAASWSIGLALGALTAGVVHLASARSPY